MLYRITIDFGFSNYDPIDDILDKLQDHWDAAVPINPGQLHMEPCFVHIQQCFHDETPPKPCITTFYEQKPPPP